VIAEIELIAATSSALAALGIPGCTIRINDRRLLTSMLAALGFAAEAHAEVLITLDKLDKIGTAGVLDELRERGHAADAIEALSAVPAFAAFGAEAASATVSEGHHESAAAGALTADSIAALLPAGVDEQALADLAAIAEAVGGTAPLVFDPFLVRGMGYYTGPIFEVAHPQLGYSLGGGGRYDGMIGRFLGTDVPATGFSLGFERLIDLVELPADEGEGDAALVYDRDVEPAALLALQRQLVAEGARVRLVKRPKNLKSALDQLAVDGFARFATVSQETGTDASALDWRPLERSA